MKLFSLKNLFRDKKSDNTPDSGHAGIGDTPAPEKPRPELMFFRNDPKLENLTFLELQALIDKAKEEGEPIGQFVYQQILLLEKAHDEFVDKTIAMGYSMNDPRVGEIEVQQYAAMRQLSQQIGDELRAQKYDMLIRRVRVRIFGEENTRRFFDKD